MRCAAAAQPGASVSPTQNEETESSKARIHTGRAHTSRESPEARIADSSWCR